jgi:hypothetical protein
MTIERGNCRNYILFMFARAARARAISPVKVAACLA